MRSADEIRQEIDRVQLLKSQAYAHGDWQLSNELRRRIDALKWVLVEDQDKIPKFRSEQDIVQIFKQICTQNNVKGRTLLSKERFIQAYSAVKYVIEHNVPGCIVECGVFRGGALAIMGLALNDAHEDRRVWGFDTFEGHPLAKKGERHQGKHAASELDVLETFEQLGVDVDLSLIRGMVQNTLPEHLEAIGEIAVLRLDVDTEPATRVCLQELYKQVADGGIVIIDDYGKWEGCRQAVNQFRIDWRINSPMRQIDSAGWFWIKGEEEEK